ncbi:MAG: 2OG-Fe dioxygenase family protein [Nitrosomonadales bacterium]|nr:2OG-Fe dioxygenase family protein [Nitrosomonadales bacterium]
MINSLAQDTILEQLTDKVEQAGFCFAPNHQMRSLLQADDTQALIDWEIFAESWNDMPLDQYMADGGRYRRRRYATLSATELPGSIRLEAHQPHYQSLDYNRLNGGVAREFEPIAEAVMSSHTMTSVLNFCHRLFANLLPSPAWHIEVHQFRIEASNEYHGSPTPEGVHRDGVDFVLVMMVKRVNISSGTTTMHDLELRNLDSFTLTEPLDTAIVNDHRCMHGVTPVEQIDQSLAAYRDVLVVTFRRKI